MNNTERLAAFIRNDEELFWRNVMPVTESGCWIWTGPVARGYGMFGISGMNAMAHRISYRLIKGSIEDGLELDHTCRVKCCVNPDHLDPVTHAVNQLRGAAARGFRNKSSITHCPQGHAYAESNTIVYKRNDHHHSRHCRECFRQRRQLKIDAVLWNTVQDYARQLGITANRYIADALFEQMKRDGIKVAA